MAYLVQSFEIPKSRKGDSCLGKLCFTIQGIHCGMSLIWCILREHYRFLENLFFSEISLEWILSDVNGKKSSKIHIARTISQSSLQINLWKILKIKYEKNCLNNKMRAAFNLKLWFFFWVELRKENLFASSHLGDESGFYRKIFFGNLWRTRILWKMLIWLNKIYVFHDQKFE